MTGVITSVMRDTNCSQSNAQEDMFHVQHFDCSAEAVGKRVQAVRQARRESMLEFVFSIADATGRRFDPSKISKIETGKQEASLLDIAILAAMDPAARGREWLAYGSRESRSAERMDGVPYEEGTPVTLDDQRPGRVAEAGRPYPASGSRGAESERGQLRRKRRRPK